MGSFITCFYTPLLPLLYPEHRLVDRIPPSGKFLMIREITSEEHSLLLSIYPDDFIVVSKRYAESELTREGIIERVKKLRKSRKSPKHSHLSNSMFMERVRRFYVNNLWPAKGHDEESLYDLYANIDSAARYRILFLLLEKHHPDMIVASLLTFIAKCLRPELAKGATFAYRRVIAGKRRRVMGNHLKALDAYLRIEDDPRWRCLVFVYTLGDPDVFHS